MIRHLRKPIIIIVLAISLGLLGVFIGRTVAAQGTGQAGSDRVEGAQARTGRIEELTPEKYGVLNPAGMDTLYSFAGVLNGIGPAGVRQSTAVECANVDPVVSTQIELQVFQYNATSVYTGTITVDPLETATFEVGPIDFYYCDVCMSAGPIAQGLGLILTEHDHVVCTAQALDPENSPPTWSFDLPLYSAAATGNILFPVMLKDSSP